MFVTSEHFEGMTMFQQIHTSLIAWRKFFFVALFTVGMSLGLKAYANPEAPDAFMQQLSNELLEVVRKDPAVKAGDLQKLANLVDTRVLPNVNFQRMTASAVGPA